MRQLIEHVFSYHKVQLAVFPEFISFIVGRKKIVRIVLDKSDKEFDFGLFNKYGFHVHVSKLYCTNQSNSFSKLIASPEGYSSSYLHEVNMYSISRSSYELKEFEKAELYGDVEKAGTYLGYPSCCVKNIDEINKLEDKWALFYLEEFQANNFASCYTNRFPITWGGVSIVGELFPCSLNCSAAKSYARNMLSDVKEFGLRKLSSKIIEHSKKSVFINRETGFITTLQDTLLHEIKFSAK